MTGPVTPADGGDVRTEDVGGRDASEARFWALAAASADVIYRMSPDWSEMRQLDGRGLLVDTPAPSDGWLTRYIHADDQGRVTAAIEDAVRTGHPFALEHRVIRADGTLGWISSRAVAVRDDAGAIVEWVGAATDITARREAAAERERLLEEAQAARAAADLEHRRLLAVLEQLPVGVHVAEAPSGRLVLDNAAVRVICGEAPRSECVADYSTDYSGAYPAGHPRAGEALASDAWPLSRALATGSPIDEELVEIRRADGTRRLVSISAAPVRDAEGRMVGAVATNVDVTERERLRADEGIARERAERLQALTAVLAATTTTDDVLDAIVRHVSATVGAVGTVVARLSEDGESVELLRALDMPSDVGTEWRRFPVSTPAPLADAVRTCEPVYLESRADWEARYPHLLHALAATGHQANMVVPLVLDGRVLGVLGTAFLTARTFDAEARREACAVAQLCAQALERTRLFEAERAARAESEGARAQLEQQVRLFEGVASTTPDFVYLFDRDGRFQYANRRLLEVWGMSLADAVGRTCLELGYERWHHEMHMREIAQVVATKQPITGEVPFRAPLTGIYGVYEYIFTPVLGPDGEVALVAGTTRDVTERKEAEAEHERLLKAEGVARDDAERARAEAEAANRAKSEFLAIMSHELRTPLNAIGGYAELMEMGIRGPVTAEQREDLRRLQASQRHLLGLINEVLNYAKLETGAVEYALTPVSLRDALTEAETLVAPQARARGLTLTVAECAPDLAVRADGEKLRQILVNLLSNAVKFTDRGGRVVLGCAAVGDQVEVAVRDTGIGIATDHLDRIFDPFVQVRTELTRTAEGTGLGLAISRDLARGMGGDLTVTSDPGVGSTFTLTLRRVVPEGR